MQSGEDAVAVALALKEIARDAKRKRRRGPASPSTNTILAGGADVSNEAYVAAFLQQYGKRPYYVNGVLLRNVNNLKINNHVYTAAVGKTLDLDKLLRRTAFMGAEYSKRKKFPSLGLHLAADERNSRAAVSIFGTGRIVCLGCQSRPGVLGVFAYIHNILERCFPDVGPMEIRARNVVGTMYLDLTIDLGVFSCYIKKHEENRSEHFNPSRFDTDDFPGMQWCDENGIQSLIFASGKVVLTGVKSETDIGRGAAAILERIQRCRMLHPNSIQYNGT